MKTYPKPHKLSKGIVKSNNIPYLYYKKYPYKTSLIIEYSIMREMQYITTYFANFNNDSLKKNLFRYNNIISNAQEKQLNNLFKKFNNSLKEFTKKAYNTEFIPQNKNFGLEKVKTLINGNISFFFETENEFNLFNKIFSKNFKIEIFSPINEKIKEILEEDVKEYGKIRKIYRKSFWIKNKKSYEYKINFNTFNMSKFREYKSYISEIISNFSKDIHVEDFYYTSNIYLNEKDLENILLVIVLANKFNIKTFKAIVE